MKAKLTEKVLSDAELPDGTAQLVVWDENLTGFGVVVGRQVRTFIVQARVAGRPRRVKIGIVGRIREDGHTWNVARARIRATEILGDMAAGVHPYGDPEKHGPTLSDGLKLHLENMAKKECSPRSIHSMETEIPRLLGEWLVQPITALTGVELKKVCDRIQKETKARAGNVNAPGQAQANRLMAQVSAIWNSLDRLYDLPGKNPAKRLVSSKLNPKTRRIPNDGFKDWLKTVQSLNPVRRDLQLFTLFTAVRSEGIRTARWEDIDLKAKLFTVQKAKGNKPYTVPLSTPTLTILRRRKKENQKLFEDHGGDQGWIFPSVTRAKPYKVIATAESKELRYEKKTRRRITVLPGLHALRRTHNSVALECGVPQEVRERLLNHNGQGVNLQHYSAPEDWSYTTKQQEKIATAILERLGTDSI